MSLEGPGANTNWWPYIFVFVHTLRILEYNRECIIIKGVFRLRGEIFAVSCNYNTGLETAR
jgi:hypothetical protein